MMALFAGPYGAMALVAEVAILGWLFQSIFSALRSESADSTRLYRGPRAQRRDEPSPHGAPASEPAAGGAAEPPKGGVILDVFWDLETQRQTARIIGGRYVGLRLDELTRDECLRLLEDCSDCDVVGEIFLGGYMKQRFAEPGAGPGREKPRGGSERREREPPRASSARARAYAALGLRVGASEKDILKAHRELIKKFHPDRGGSTAKAAAVNEAKDILLEKGR